MQPVSPRSVITGFDERSTCGVTFVHNESVAALAERHPDRFIPFAGADIMRGSSALAELEHWVLEHAQLRGVLGDQTYESLARKGEAMTTAAMATYAFDQIDQAQRNQRCRLIDDIRRSKNRLGLLTCSDAIKLEMF